MSQRVVVPQLDIDEITLCIKNAVREADNEEKVRFGVSSCIQQKILDPLGLGKLDLEFPLISGNRVDALYGHVVIEYKAPGKLSSRSDVLKARDQVIKYIEELAKTESEYGRYLGVIISDRIAFVRYDPRNKSWILRGPYDIRREVIIKLVEAFRGLRRKKLDVDSLVKDFGPQSPIAKRTIKLFYDKLKGSERRKVKMLFEDWMRLFKQATGYKPEDLEELPKLAEEYGLRGNVDYDVLIFSIHTYYALIMKLIAAEIAYLYGSGKFYRSYIAELDDAYFREGVEGVRRVLKSLESGGVFRDLLNIENFLEGDYFSWYLDELDRDLADTIAEIARRLSDYEVATPQLEPEFARDLLKRLYQHLVPSDLRHRLGEYYTPDWLAELVLDEVGLSLDNLRKMGEEDPLKPLKIRVLDPACGSGTFLILYISRLRRYAEEHYLTDQLLSYLLENVVGYDLNPLAVLTARTNYLLAVADLLSYVRGRIEIPIYLADSIMVEVDTRFTRKMVFSVASYILRTVAGEFTVPIEVVDKGLLPTILAEITNALDGRYETDAFKERIRYAYTLKDDEIDALATLYETLLKLKEKGEDSVWVSILKNAFAPLLKGEFDYVVGNPPWVNWENLPETYREVSKSLWDRYGLLKVVKTGGFKRDLAMLFLARSFDRYLKKGGKLGFLIPFTLFKTQAGAGFRDFLAKKTRVHVIHDLVTLYPFEGAVNRTAMIVVEKICDYANTTNGGKCPQMDETYRNNVNGIKHIIWVNPSGKPIPTDMSLQEVLEKTRRYEAVIIPLMPYDPSSPWMQTMPQIVKVVRNLIRGTQHYEAHAGVYTSLNQVYFIEIIERLPDGNLRIRNPPEPGAKREVKEREAVIEPDLVYPLIRGRDIKRWYVGYENRYIIVPHDPLSGMPIPQKDLMVKFPRTYDYLNQYREDLKKRSIKPFLSLREKIKKARSEYEKKNLEKILDEKFYILDNIGPYTFAPYKVVWKAIAGAITGKAVEFACAVVESLTGKLNVAKPVVPDHSVLMIGFAIPEEAYYVAGLLNSTLVRTIIASYSYELGQYTHIVDLIKLPKFDPSNESHKKVVELSKRAHELASEIYKGGKESLREELRRVEEELDLAVAEVLGVSRAELEEFRLLLAVLSGEELPRITS